MNTKFKLPILITYGIFVFILFLYLTFPFNLLKTRIFTTIQQQTGLTIQANSVSPLLFGGLGIKLKDVTIIGVIPGIDKNISKPIKVDKFWIGISPFSLIFAKPKVTGGTNIFDGSMSITAAFQDFFKSTPNNVKLKLSDINLTSLLNLNEEGIDLKGNLSGVIKLEGDLSNPASLSGEIDSTIEGLSVKKSTFQGFNIPEIFIKKGIIKASILKGDVKIEQFEIGVPTEDIHFIYTGGLKLGRRVQFSQANLIMKVKFSEKLKKELQAFLPLLEPAKKPDGYYVFVQKGGFGDGFPLPMPQP